MKRLILLLCCLPWLACASGYTDDFHLGSGAQYTVFSNNVSGTNRGRFQDWEIWAPPVQHPGAWNFLDYENITMELSNRGTSVADLWATSNNVHQFTFVTTASMANSHSIGYSVVGIIPAGLPDGGGGAFAGGSLPGNANYQEIGLYDGTAQVLSPGHLAEAIGVTVMDNNGGAGVPAVLTGIQVGLVKNSPDDTYPSYGVHPYSFGTSPGRSALRVDGLWKNGLDLSGMQGDCPIKMQDMTCVTEGPPDSCGPGYRCLRVPN